MDNIILLALCGGPLLIVAALAIAIALQNWQADRDIIPPTAPIPGQAPAPVGFSAPGNRDLARQVQTLLEANRKADAIKLYREATGLSLRESSDAVEQVERTLFRAQFARQSMPSPTSGATPPAGSSGAAVPGDWRNQVVALLRAGRKIEAIQLYRAATRTDLARARNAVEALDRNLRS